LTGIFFAGLSRHNIFPWTRYSPPARRGKRHHATTFLPA
jgi:hypothetical protein